jgi:hypothetical protein
MENVMSKTEMLNELKVKELDICKVPDLLEELKEKVELSTPDTCFADDRIGFDEFGEEISEIIGFARSILEVNWFLSDAENYPDNTIRNKFPEWLKGISKETNAFELSFMAVFPQLYLELVQKYKKLLLDEEKRLQEDAEFEAEFIEHLPNGDARFRAELLQNTNDEEQSNSDYSERELDVSLCAK